MSARPLLLALAVCSGILASAQAAYGQGFSSLEAINRCEAFVETALLAELGTAFKEPHKITCYFALSDPMIHSEHAEVCARVSRALAEPLRAISHFICVGTYETYLRENTGEATILEP